MNLSFLKNPKYFRYYLVIGVVALIGVFFLWKAPTRQSITNPIKEAINEIKNTTDTQDTGQSNPTASVDNSTPAKIVGKVVSAEEVHQDCESKIQPADKFDCYEQVFTSYMKANDKSNAGQKTLQLLEDLRKMGGYSQSNCHPLSHKVGNIAFHVYGSVLAAVPQYLAVCASGYYHGLLEEYLATAPDYEDGIKTVCGKADVNYINWFQCTHGLGHGVMQHDDNEVPQSLKDCDVLDPANQAREICYAGVFMENVTTDEKTGHPAKYIKPSDPIYPCNFVETKYKSACYFLSSSQILKINGWNFQNGFDVCDKNAEKDYRWLCYESMGRDVSGSSLQNKDQVIKLCMLGAPDMRDECFFGAVRDFINDKGTFDTAVDLCNSTPEDYRQKCYSGIYLDLGLYKKGQDFLNVCATMPDPYKTQCNQSVRY